jgi:hypothetical protein
VIVVPVDKIAWRCRWVTRRARQRSALGNKPTKARTLCSISRYTEILFATKSNYTEKNGDLNVHAPTRKEDGTAQKV